MFSDQPYKSSSVIPQPSLIVPPFTVSIVIPNWIGLEKGYISEFITINSEEGLLTEKF